MTIVELSHQVPALSILRAASEQEMRPWQALDVSLDSDNEWDIPTLDLNMQAVAVPDPVTKWGVIARTSHMPGTYHFYTDDYKFRALWGKPEPVPMSGCQVAVEVNWSTNQELPKAVVLWHTYRKRWLARYWQLCGVRVLVDLNVEPEFAALNMIGVPSGWRAYATRWLDWYGAFNVMEQWEMAKEHAQSNDILFVVFGGRGAAQEVAKRYGWTWFKEHAGRVNDG